MNHRNDIRYDYNIEIERENRERNSVKTEREKACRKQREKKLVELRERNYYIFLMLHYLTIHKEDIIGISCYIFGVYLAYRWFRRRERKNR